MKDDIKKMFTPPLGTNSEFFHRAFANQCMMKVQQKAQLELRAYWPLGSLPNSQGTGWRCNF
jgi:hypothetical protein